MNPQVRARITPIVNSPILQQQQSVQGGTVAIITPQMILETTIKEGVGKEHILPHSSYKN